jgi:hypothetical protein
MRVVALLGLLLASLGCDSRAADLARVSEHAAPHLQRFAAFDRWARRVGVDGEMPRAGEALSEAVFAPIRGERWLLAAWVQLEGERARLLALPGGVVPPPLVRWAALRDPSLGPLRVAVLEHCGLQVPRGWRPSAQGPCVLISRSAPSSEPALTVTVAFAASGAAERGAIATASP